MSIRAKTKRRLLILTGCGVLVVAVLTSLWAYRMDQIAKEMAEHREQGLAAIEEGDYPTALEHLKEYRRRNRDDVEVAYHMAVAARQVERPEGRHLREALNVYQDLLDLDPDHEQAQRDLLDLYVDVRFDVEAIELADRMLQRDPEDVEVMRRKAISLARLRRLDEALEVAKQAVELEPQHLPTHERVLQILGRLDRPPEELVEWAQQYHEQFPEDPRFEALLGFAYGITRDNEQAIEWINRAASRDVEDPQLIRRLATLLAGVGEFRSSLEFLQRSVQRVDDPDLRHMLARRLFENSRYDDLLALLEEVDPSAPETDSGLVALKAAALLHQGDREQAEQLVQALEAREGDNVARAWAPVLSQVVGRETQNPQDVVEVCRTSIEMRADIPYVRAYLAEALARIGETELAVEQWQNATQLAPAWATPHIRLAQTFNETNRPREALQHARAARQRAPGSLLAAITFSEVLATLVEQEEDATDQDAQVLVNLLEQIRENASGAQQTLPTYVNVLADRGQRDQAITAIEDALEDEGSLSQQLLLNLAEISRQKELGLTDRLLDTAEEHHGMTANLAYARAVTQHVAGESEAARQQFRERLRERGQDDVSWQLAYARFLDVTNHEQAADQWRKLVEEHPDNINLQRTVLSARAVRDDRELLDDVIERVRELGGDQGLTWRLARARWLLGSGEASAVSSAIEMLEEVIRNSPNLLEPRLLLAEAMEKAGDAEGAIEQLTIASSNIQPNNMQILLQLAQLHASQGEYDQTRQLVQRIIEHPQSGSSQRSAAADLLAKLGESEQAIAVLSGTGEVEGTSSALLLAELHLRRNERDEAEEIYQQVMERDPNASAIQAYSNFLGALGRHQEAGEVLAQAEELDLSDTVVAMLRAEYTRRYGSADRAVAYYRDAIEAEPNNASVWRRLIDFHIEQGDVDEALAVAEEARGAVPGNRGFSLLAQHSDLIRLAAVSEQVRPVIRAMLHDEGNRDVALQSLQVLGTAQQEEQSFGEAAESVGRLANRNPRFFQLQMLAMDLYASAGQRDQAVSVAERAMQNFPNRPDPARRATELLGAQGEWSRMRYVARQWRERELYNPIQADVAIAEAELNLDNPREALQQIDSYLERARSEPNRSFPVLSVYARAMATLGEADRAAEAIEPLLSQAQAWRNLWVNVASRLIEDPQLAADWLERVEPMVPEQNVEERAALATHWYQLGTRNDVAEYRQRGLSQLAELAGEDRATPTAHVAYAVAAYQEGDLETAETHYRRTLEASEDHPVAMNNLAMLLAEQGRELAEAQRLAERAVELRPDEASYYDTLAFVQMEREQYADAVANLQNAVRLDPGRVEWRVNLAAAHHLHGEGEDARRTLRELESLNPDLDPQSLSPAVRARLEQLREELAEARAQAP